MRLLERVRHVLGPTPSDRSRLWPVGILALALPVALWAASAGLIGPSQGVVTADDDDRQVRVRRARDDDGDDERRPAKPNPNKARQVVIEEKVIRNKQDLAEQEARTRFTRDDDASIRELRVLVKQLVSRVERLQAEVNELRSDQKRSADGGEEVEIRERKRVRDQAEQQGQIGQKKAIAQAEQAELRARRQAELRKREAVEREVEAKERALEEKLEAIEREKEAKERAAERKRATGSEDPTDKEDDDLASDNIKRKFTELAELTKLEALKFLDIDKKALIEKVQAQAAEAAKQAADAGELAAKVKAQAQDAVKRVLAEKKFIEIEKIDKEDAKPVKKKPADDAP
jgi:hypothetical protein